MLDSKIQITIKADFEKMIAYLRAEKKPFGLPVFGEYACSVLNFYVGSKLISLADKKNAALYICDLYNAGIKNSIVKEDLVEIAAVIASDPTLDYQVINPIFS